MAFGWNSNSIVRHYEGSIFDRPHKLNQHLEQIKKLALKSHVSRFEVKDLIQFNSRLTSIAWHPGIPNFVASATKHGDINVFQGCRDETNDAGVLKFKEKFKTKGHGPGGSILAMKFHPLSREHIYIAGMEGTVAKLNMEREDGHHIYLDTQDYWKWFTAMDISAPRKLIAGGDTHGRLFLVPMDAENGFADEFVIHKKTKVLHCEFHPTDPNILVTSCLDQTVKIWDLRKIQKSSPTPLYQFATKKGSNVARFSPDGLRLLTSDQGDEIRVYTGPFWGERPLIIEHHHRQFQHMTPIKASWHPLSPIIVVGLYPVGLSKASQKQLQFIDAETGAMIHELDTPNNGILSLNECNPTGEIIASGTGNKFAIWQPTQDNLTSLAIQPRGVKNLKVKRLPDAMVNVLRGVARGPRRTHLSDDEDEDENVARKKPRTKTKTTAKPKDCGTRGKGKKK